MTVPYPDNLREALIRRFQWEILFSDRERADGRREGRSGVYRRMRVPLARLRCAGPVRHQPALSHQ